MADITIVGGINIDIEGAPRKELVFADSNPGRIGISFGGVGRNIAENDARLGEDVAMISLIGDDFLGERAKEELAALGVDVSGVVHAPGQNTGMYLSILNHKNDMELGICNMDILEQITLDFLDRHISQMAKSKIVCLDCNLRREAIEYLTEKLSGTPLFLEPVSASKAERVKGLVGRFYAIKPNLIEAELLSGISIKDDKSLSAAGKWFEDQGVKQTFISLGEDGVYYRENGEEGIVGIVPTAIASATGAGDAFSAAILRGFVRGATAKETAHLGVACASIALESYTAVNPNLNLEEVKKRAGIE